MCEMCGEYNMGFHHHLIKITRLQRSMINDNLLMYIYSTLNLQLFILYLEILNLFQQYKT